LSKSKEKTKDILFPPIYITSEDIRQYIYCQRIPFIRSILRFRPVTTAKMERGKRQHKEIHKFSLPPTEKENYPKRLMNLYLFDTELHIHGQIDMIELVEKTEEIEPGITIDIEEIKENIETKKLGCIIEIKTGKKKTIIPDHHKAQVIFQAILAEKYYDIIIYAGKIYNTQTEEYQTFVITKNSKEHMKTNIKKLQEIYQSEIMPEPTPHEAKCVNCEYWVVCQRV